MKTNTYRLFAFSFLALTAHLAADPVTLLTDEQAARAQATEDRTKNAHPNYPEPAPQIQIVKPAGGQVSGHPFPLVVTFSTSGGSTIDPNTIRIDIIGPLETIDVTDTVRDYTTAGGIVIPETNMTKGTYDIRLRIRDTQGRLGELEQIWSIQ
jgi:hypothetical protein